MARRRRNNPLALAILCTLYEQPRHPYDVASTLKSRHKHESIKLNYGALYSVFDSLLGEGYIQVVETVRQGRRPERTIYGITDEGVRELTDWLSDLVATPQKEYSQFEAALSLLPSLPPSEAADLLDQRIEAIDIQLARYRAERTVFQDELGLPRLFAIENEYAEALLVAERAYVVKLVTEIRTGTLDGLEMWRAWYEPGGGFEIGGSTEHRAGSPEACLPSKSVCRPITIDPHTVHR